MNDNLLVRQIVVGVVQRAGRVLLLRRAKDNEPFAGQWEHTAGKIELGESLTEAVVREAGEETGLDLALERQGSIYEIDAGGFHWVVHPFLLSAAPGEVVVCAEHDSYQWISPDQLMRVDYVPGTDRDLIAIGLVEAIS